MSFPRKIDGATRYLGAPQGWKPDESGSCGHLSIRDMDVPGTGKFMLSCWEPTPGEIEKIKRGGHIYLSVWGTAHPPVAVWADDIDSPQRFDVAERHNQAIFPILKSLITSEKEADAMVLLESVVLGVFRFFGRTNQDAAVFCETMAERLLVDRAQK